MFDVAGVQPQRDSRVEVKMPVPSVRTATPPERRQTRDTAAAGDGTRLIEAPEAA